MTTELRRLAWLILLCGGCGLGLSAGETHPPAAEPPASVPECDVETLRHARKLHAPVPYGSSFREGCGRLGSPAVAFTICPDGGIAAAEILRSSRCEQADRELLRCLAEWRYEPAVCDGQRVEEGASIVVNWGHGPPPGPATDPCRPCQTDDSENCDASGAGKPRGVRATCAENPSNTTGKNPESTSDPDAGGPEGSPE